MACAFRHVMVPGKHCHQLHPCALAVTSCPPPLPHDLHAHDLHAHESHMPLSLALCRLRRRVAAGRIAQTLCWTALLKAQAVGPPTRCAATDCKTLWYALHDEGNLQYTYTLWILHTVMHTLCIGANQWRAAMSRRNRMARDPDDTCMERVRHLH